MFYKQLYLYWRYNVGGALLVLCKHTNLIYISYSRLYTFEMPVCYLASILSISGPCKVRNETETNRSETKRLKQNES